MSVSDKDYEDVTVYGLDDSGEAELLTKQTECTFIWSSKDGHPVGVIMNFVFRDGSFWLTASSQRARVPAVRRDPRVSIAVSSHGSAISSRRSLTYGPDWSDARVAQAPTTAGLPSVHIPSRRRSLIRQPSAVRTNRSR